MSKSAQDRTLARHPRPLGGDTAKDRRGVQVALSGMVLNNNETQQLHLGRKPDWLRARVPGGLAMSDSEKSWTRMACTRSAKKRPVQTWVNAGTAGRPPS